MREAAARHVSRLRAKAGRLPVQLWSTFATSRLGARIRPAAAGRRLIHPGRRWPFLGAAGVVAVVCALGWVVETYVNPTTSEQRTGLLQAAAQIVAGLLLFGSLFFTSRTLRVNQETLRINQETLRLNEQGQVTERFTRAIDQLGAVDTEGRKRLELRLGAIYALERIARDSPRDHWPVMEVLTAYVREHARRPPVNPDPDPEPPTDREIEEAMLAPRVPGEPRAPVDIQAALNVIGRRIRTDDREQRNILDLSAADLRHVQLRGLHFEGANFADADLRGAELSQTHFEGALLASTMLEGVDLSFTRLKGAWFFRTHLDRARLHAAELDGTDFGGCHLSGAILSEASLLRAAFNGAFLIDASLEGAKLDGASFSEAILHRTRLGRARLVGANLRYTDLRWSKGLTRQQVEEAIMDETTWLPPELGGHDPEPL